MSSVERGALFPTDDFKYPTPFDVAKYRKLEKIDEWHFERGNHRFKAQKGNHGSAISPRQALLRYAASPAGSWQVGQRARYPILHADLNPDFVDVQSDEELETLKHDVLDLIAHPFNPHSEYANSITDIDRYGHRGLDFHPIGHMAQVAISMDTLLMLHPASDSINPDPFLLQAIRHTAALHDAGESVFPGIEKHHGAAIGDIGADRGKTGDDRKLEKAILEHVIKATFYDVYNDEFSEAVVALASHDSSKFDESMRTYHAISELNHELNTLSTAIYLGRKGLKLANEYPMPANLMTALASDSIIRGIKKRDHLKQEGLSPELTLVLTEKLRDLFWVVADRDEDQSYKMWRDRLAVEERFGPFRPNSPSVRIALDEG